MSSPMFDIPEHLAIPVNAKGQGPVDDADAVAHVCWCDDRNACEVCPPKKVTR